MFSRLFLRAFNSVVNLVVILALMLSGSYAVYALWDNNQVLESASDVQADMIKLKPDVELDADEEPDNSDSFAELLKINEDVCSWLTMDNTRIDFPVLQGDTNLSYISTDVYGNFALAGSIYLDSNNDPEFNDSYSLLYGHHMADGRMFGDLDLYKDETFFKENTTGLLILPRKAFNLKVIACLVVKANDRWFFEPMHVQDEIEDLLNYTEENALHLHRDMLRIARQTEDLHLLALSTCSSEFSDARTIVLTLMEPVNAG